MVLSFFLTLLVVWAVAALLLVGGARVLVYLKLWPAEWVKAEGKSEATPRVVAYSQIDLWGYRRHEFGPVGREPVVMIPTQFPTQQDTVAASNNVIAFVSRQTVRSILPIARAS